MPALANAAGGQCRRPYHRKPAYCWRCGAAFSADADIELIGENDEVEIPPVNSFVVRHRSFMRQCRQSSVAVKASALILLPGDTFLDSHFDLPVVSRACQNTPARRAFRTTGRLT
jgi:hypothetical protein